MPGKVKAHIGDLVVIGKGTRWIRSGILVGFQESRLSIDFALPRNRKTYPEILEYEKDKVLLRRCIHVPPPMGVELVAEER
jgi:hypothetical protein